MTVLNNGDPRRKILLPLKFYLDIPIQSKKFRPLLNIFTEGANFYEATNHIFI